AEVEKIYAAQTGYLKKKLREYVTKGALPEKARAYYPEIRVVIEKPSIVDARVSYGFVAEPGVYSATLTRPDVMADYYREQIALLIENHGVKIHVGVSESYIPILYALTDEELRDLAITAAARDRLPDYFDVPREELDDRIIDDCWEPTAENPGPLSLFSAPRIDYSLVRLRHYTGTRAKDFQDFVIFTNYGFYMQQFEALARELMGVDAQCGLQLDYDEFKTPDYTLLKTKSGIERKDHPLGREPQMPTYHLKRKNNKGITIVNIGVGPSNAKTMTDHIAVLRPDAWLMLGHCGGLANTQRIGDYVLAHTYVRDDRILDDKLPLNVPIPSLAEMEIALKGAIAEVTGKEPYEIKQIVRTGAVLTTADRNWEIEGAAEIRFNNHQTRAIAVDMESATIAANGFRYRVPYGTFLCVSDMPIHGLPKMPGMADQFYNAQRDQHLLIGLRAMEKLITEDQRRLHSRKLRGPYEPAFR
ncbi:MAG TPA: AMP nucleosidase, partial [Alphaproteobacteria bacterium]|nr:AMP nucleosidase [Alphaproteobacteria bacterium]